MVTIATSAQQPIRVACIGDGMTSGTGMANREKNNYPAQLQNMLGSGYTVRNFGTDSSFISGNNSRSWRQALQYRPDVVLVGFGNIPGGSGLNAAMHEYQELVRVFGALHENPRIVLLLPPVLPADSLRVTETFAREIRRAALLTGNETVDLHQLMAEKQEFFQDKTHLSSLGATVIARRLYETVKMQPVGGINIFIPLNAKQDNKGFPGYRSGLFTWKGTTGRAIRPQRAAKGLPWAWLTGEPYDTLTAVALLERGFHIICSQDTLPELRKKMLAKGFSGHVPIVRPGTPLSAALQAAGRKINFAALPAPGSEYRSGAGWKEGKDWWAQHADIDSLLHASRNLDVLFIGNSITQGIGGHRTGTTYRPGFAVFDSILKGLSWECAGISGDRTQNVLWRLQNGSYRHAAPKLAVLTIGVNNFPDDGPEEVAEGIKTILGWLRTNMPATRVILIGPLPAGLTKDEMRRIKYDRTQAIISQFRITGVTYLPLAETFIQPDGNINRRLYSNDGIHLLPAGYRAWAQALAPVIDRELK
ncbi:GDSL-type esterase/lipase family protein [Chitinophaga barathri]|nr:GDSL-type esterase/lipase family protein [Chitinophaga barathri]